MIFLEFEVFTLKGMLLEARFVEGRKIYYGSGKVVDPIKFSNNV